LLVVKDFDLDPGKLLFIEHCPDRGSRLEHYRESFDIVRFRWDGTCFNDPEWESVKKQDVDELIRD
jgi:hypothetical protein